MLFILCSFKSEVYHYTKLIIQKHFEEMKRAIRHPKEEKPKPKEGGQWFINPVTRGWINLNDWGDLIGT